MKLMPTGNINGVSKVRKGHYIIYFIAEKASIWPKTQWLKISFKYLKQCGTQKITITLYPMTNKLDMNIMTIYDAI